ncbi:DUF2993 domain-containing protein [Microbacterium sp.]|uniref:LmeA family phospholipid-binding protein n=1 Tax=Microbacterium sp. TaxID=51671 RepID=UPI0039E2BC28
MTSADAVAAPRRSRWPRVLLIAVLVLAVLAVAAELIARSVLPGIVRGIVIEQLDLPADQQLDVAADGVLLPQLIAGSLNALHLSSEQVTIGTLTGAAEVTAHGVPLRGGDLGSASGTVRIDESQFAPFVQASGLPIESISLAEPDVTAEGSVSVLGISLPLSLTVTPEADAGELVLVPKAATIGGFELTAEELEMRLGELGEQLTQPQWICIADRLPAGIRLTAISVQGAEVVADFDVDGAALYATGSCPTS